MYAHRWQELAKDEQRLGEAAREYMGSLPAGRCTLAEAHRHVREFHRTFKQRYGR